MARSKRIELKKPKRLSNRKSRKQRGGSPAYRLHGSLGLLSQQSLNYAPVPLTVHGSGHSDHIVHTSGGGCGKKHGKKHGKKKHKKKSKSRSARGVVVLTTGMRARVRARQKSQTSKSVRKGSSSSSGQMLTQQRVSDKLPLNLKTRVVNRLAPSPKYVPNYLRKRVTSL
jgi:hypothetical protein